jgi:hypothetical protein
LSTTSHPRQAVPPYEKAFNDVARFTQGTYVETVAGRIARFCSQAGLPMIFWSLVMLVRLTRQHVAQAAGFVAVIIAALSLIGWWAELPVAAHWAVKPLAALYLVCVGLAVTHDR